MPTYEYRCRTCDTRFELKRSMSASSDPASCPSGHDETVRLLSSFAAVGAAGGGAPIPSGGAGCGGACACHPG